MSGSLKVAACVSLVLTGCTTLQGYEGERRPSDEVARVTGDFRISAGAPVSVILLQVDGHTLGTGSNSIALLPGEHTFLVNCRVAETNALSRHSIVAEVVAGRHYRFEADTGPGLRECTDVRLVSGR